MVQVSYPGIYTLEVPSGVRSITGVSTSIAAFVGMAKRGRLREPTRVLGFQDYERKYSADTSLGEMTEQVRQFFLNGGEVAYIVRIADNAAQEASAVLSNEAGDPVLTLTARDAGTDSNQIRAEVDYDTSSPERTFNLTIFRERFDSSGVPFVEAIEVHQDLGMSETAPRFVETIIGQQSQLATAAINAANVAAAATLDAFSASASLPANAVVAIQTAIANANGGGPGTFGRFGIRVGDSPLMTIQIDSVGLTLLTIETAINTQLHNHNPAININVTAAANGPIRFDCDQPGHDVVIEPAGQLDIARELGLGVTQGGVEIGTYAAARPSPSGLISHIDGAVPGDLDALLSFAGAAKATLDNVGVTGVRPFSAATVDLIYPDPAGDMFDGTVVTSPSLLNVRENLSAIANVLSAMSDDWRVTVHGYRLAFRTTFGDTSAGPGAAFVSATPDLTLANEIFENETASRRAEALVGGLDGGKPAAADYAAAYQQIDEQVDLFNLLVLPKSSDDTASPSDRSAQWGPASVFCQLKRAFLLVDAEPDPVTVEEMLNEIQPLRNGVVKDHAAVYWPKLTITADGVQKNIDPSGSIAGLMSRIDGSRGVWKAPAGLEGDLRGVVGVQVPMSDGQNGLLNPQAINAIRPFPNGILSWGARTLDGFDNSGNTDYKYIPPRRLALFIEESLVRGLRFALFEPNDEPLWGQIRLAAGAFMNGLFRRKAFAGQTASDAYFVKADAESTTATDINLGIVNVLIGFAPVKPAEFIVIRLQQKAGQVQV